DAFDVGIQEDLAPIRQLDFRYPRVVVHDPAELVELEEAGTDLRLDQPLGGRTARTCELADGGRLEPDPVLVTAPHPADAVYCAPASATRAVSRAESRGPADRCPVLQPVPRPVLVRSSMPRRRLRAAAPVRVSVLMRVCAGDGPAVARSLASLRSQRLRDWEIVVAATPPAAAPLRAPGIRLVELDVDHRPAVDYERCRAHAAGDFLLLLVPVETLAPSTLAKAVSAFDGSESTPVVYADEDRIDAAGSHHAPFLRPDWSPDYLLSALYIDRAFFVRRAAVDAVGGLRADYDPVPEWDLLLRLSELGRPFAHIREVLFHR